MDNSDNLHDQIYASMQLKTTEELTFILEQDDHEEWSEAAFEVVKQILVQRTGALLERPAASTDPAEKPTDWDSVDWQAISNNCDKQLKMRGYATIFLALLALSPALLSVYLLFSPGDDKGKYTGVIAFGLLGVVFFGSVVWSYLRIRTAERIVARARVSLKHPMSRGKGKIHDVDFAIKSAFTLSESGELVANDQWLGHHTFPVQDLLYDVIDEQEIVDLIFLTNKQVLGLVEEFEDEPVD